MLGGTSCLLGEGITILSACCSNECAEELNGRGTFTSLLVDALNGGAADVMGHVTDVYKSQPVSCFLSSVGSP